MKGYFHFVILILHLVYLFTSLESEEYCKNEYEGNLERYLLYDVNPGEGFNLRRDVYIRIANLVRKLNEIEPWILVLPPWGRIYHWRNVPPSVFYPWKTFFDVGSLKKWIPVIEFDQFLQKKILPIDGAFALQNFPNMWEGRWIDKYEIADCQQKFEFKKTSKGEWTASMYNQQLRFTMVSCLSFMGTASTIMPFLTKDIRKRTIYLRHGEIMLHDDFGSASYWSARRSMRFSKQLVVAASKFREAFLNSSDLQDGTPFVENWKSFMPESGIALGGPYVCTHLRRRDFISARKDKVPSINYAAKQLTQILDKQGVQKLFVASDAPSYEIDELRSYLSDFEVLQFAPTASSLREYGDGGAAVVDQIICSHAKYFIGTYESTFSFRIQEEREILGLDSSSTFNRLCGDEERVPCEQPTQWKIVYK